jgi:uncharacterized protein (TIGR02391 family)
MLDGQGVLMSKKRPDPEPVEPRDFKSVDEIDGAITKLKRRIQDLEQFDVTAAVLNNTGADKVVMSDVHETIREVFGANSPEFEEHGNIWLWAGRMRMGGMSQQEVAECKERGRQQVITILNGLISRLKEKKEDLGNSGAAPAPSTYFDRLNLHPRVLGVSRGLFLDGHPWQAVFEASKALVNYIKERSGRHDLDGTSLVRTVFSRNDPILAFNDLSDQTKQDEQEGMMHLFEGAILGIRNPGGHSFPEGPEQRAVEYMSLLSLLAYRVQEAKRRNSP